ncbi:MAG TPA: hypothetical protein VF683_03850 [Chthoniobacterales bacterium]|jgi:hypothetical protein
MTSANALHRRVGGSFNVTATGFASPTFSETGVTWPASLGAISHVLGGTPAPDTHGAYQFGSWRTTACGGTTQPFTLTIKGVPCTAAASGLISCLAGNGNAKDLLGSNNGGPARWLRPSTSRTRQM